MKGNADTIGIEAEHPGTLSYPWPSVQLEEYYRVCAAICTHLGLPAGRVIAHKEWAPTRKIDPVGLHMGRFRESVQAVMDEGDVMAKIDMPNWAKDSVGRLARRGYFPSGTPKQETLDMWRTYTFLDRADASIIRRVEDWVRDHVKSSIAAALTAGAVGGQIDYSELVRRIGETLAGA